MFYLRCIPFVLVLRYISTYYLFCVEELKPPGDCFTKGAETFQARRQILSQNLLNISGVPSAQISQFRFVN